MEHQLLTDIASNLFENIPLALWQDKSAEEIEVEVQQLVNQVANILLGEFILPERIAQIEERVAEGHTVCAACQQPLRLHKQATTTHAKTIFGGQIELARNQYWCPHCASYEMVADRVLGFVGHRMTPRLALVTALCGASWSYEVAAAFLHFLFGVKLCAKTVENVSCDERLQPMPLASDPLDEPPGVVGMDGVLVRGREKDRWLEMKVGSFFSAVAEVSHNRREIRDASFVAGAMQKWEEFEEPVTREAERRVLNRSEEVEFVADGAAGIWGLQEVVFPYARRRLDQFHLKEKIYERTEQAYKNDRSKQKHQQALLSDVDQGKVAEAVSYIKKHLPRSEYRRESATKLINYLERHEERIPNYEQVKAEGGAVSSGLVEKGNDLIVVRRMKEGTMHWTRDGADPVIQQRTAFINKYARARIGPYELAFCHALAQ
jgi:hypothetical protein